METIAIVTDTQNIELRSSFNDFQSTNRFLSEIMKSFYEMSKTRWSSSPDENKTVFLCDFCCFIRLKENLIKCKILMR